jgi:predicted protein tyrosine phosphatase
VTRRDIEWADLILVMERQHAARLRETFRDLRLPALESLDIPDDYEFMNAALIDLIREGTEFYLSQLPRVPSQD